MEKPAAACYHLPGLFEFYELYRRFLPLYREHREYFYDWCAIGSIYGAPAGCIWGGGRISCGGAAAREVLALLLPLAKRFVTVAAHTPRAMPAETLAEHIRARGGKAEAAADIPAGVARSAELGGDGPVCALGTLYFSGDVRQAFARLTAE